VKSGEEPVLHQVSTEFLEHLIDQAPIVIFQERLEDRAITYVSANVERILGWPATEIVGQPDFFAGLMSESDQSRFEAALDRFSRGEASAEEDEFELATADGSRRWFVIAARADQTDHRNILGYAVDVTARVRSEASARMATERYRLMFEGVPSGIFRSAPEGELLEANPKLAEIFGYGSAEEFKRLVRDVGSLYLDRRERDRFMEAVRRRGRVEGFLTKLRRRDGEVIEASMNASAVRDEAGNLVAFEGTLLDVTDQRRAEEEARQARAAADAANQAKSVFLSRMSHELRTPLNSILGFGQLLELRELEPTAAESVQHILKAGRHLLDLINEVLDIARVEAGRLAMSLEPVSLAEVAEDGVALIRPLAASRQIEITIEPHPCRGYVLGDRQRLKQVLLNLLSNAVKYNRPQGQVRLACSRDEGHLKVAVSDTGRGISADQIERLFIPFDRLGADVTSEEGTGLGLMLARHLVEAMGGKLAVESEPGLGSTFTVSLTEVPGPGDWVVTQSPDRPLLSAGADARRSVLYIEDNLANLALVEQIFTHRPQVELESAMQGRMGLLLAQTHLPDLILLDVNLPDMTGREVLSELKLDPSTAQVPVLVISADASPGQIQRLLDAGAAGYLTKPLDVFQFLTEVDRLLSA
jgi:PAS domain S-box-containing protein